LRRAGSSSAIGLQLRISAIRSRDIPNSRSSFSADPSARHSPWESGSRMSEPRELDELAGDRIGDTGLALSLERRACHLPAHVAPNGCGRKNSEVCGSRAPVNRRGGAGSRPSNFRHPSPCCPVFPVRRLTPSRRPNAVALAERLAIRSGSGGRFDLSERNFPRARVREFQEGLKSPPRQIPTPSPVDSPFSPYGPARSVRPRRRACGRSQTSASSRAPVRGSTPEETRSRETQALGLPRPATIQALAVARRR
jgi:hypothetical protein